MIKQVIILVLAIGITSVSQAQTHENKELKNNQRASLKFDKDSYSVRKKIEAREEKKVRFTGPMIDPKRYEIKRKAKSMK